jgi:ribosomal protein S18 acetylase RimI-like enzyme
MWASTPTAPPIWAPASFTSPSRSQPTPVRTSGLKSLHLTYTMDPRAVEVIELADLMSRCAVHAPGNGIHAAESRTDPAADPPTDPARFHRRLRRALDNSMVCVAAYAPESALPPGLHRSGTSPPPPDPLQSMLARMAPSMGPKVLVGFARAVGDAALVATLHDVAVAPELRGRGLGAALVDRLTRHLYYRDIIDVGTIVPENIGQFWGRCSFGDDSEGSVAMALTGTGAEAWAAEGGAMVERVLRKRRVARARGAEKGSSGSGSGRAAVVNSKVQETASIRRSGS